MIAIGQASFLPKLSLSRIPVRQDNNMQSESGNFDPNQHRTYDKLQMGGFSDNTLHVNFHRNCDVGTLFDRPEQYQQNYFSHRQGGRHFQSDCHSALYKVNYMKLLSEKFSDAKQADGRPLYEDPDPHMGQNEKSVSNDDSVCEVDNLKGMRVDPHLRISQIDKLLLHNDNLNARERRALVSRRNTAKLRQR